MGHRGFDWPPTRPGLPYDGQLVKCVPGAPSAIAPQISRSDKGARVWPTILATRFRHLIVPVA
eukprot:9497509-Pyramimonas_sp.AAC.1